MQRLVTTNGETLLSIKKNITLAVGVHLMGAVFMILYYSICYIGYLSKLSAMCRLLFIAIIIIIVNKLIRRNNVQM